MRSELGVPGNLVPTVGAPEHWGGMESPGSGDPDHSCLSSRTTRGPLGPSSDLGTETLAVELLLLLIVDL